MELNFGLSLGPWLWEELLGTLTPPHPSRNFLYCLPSSWGQRFQLQDGGVGGADRDKAAAMGRPIAGTLLVSSLGLGRLRWSPSGLSEELGSQLGQFFWSSLRGQARRGFICVQWLDLEWKTWDLAQTPLSPLQPWALSLQRRGGDKEVQEVVM